MDDRRIQEAIAFLEREVPRDGARVKLHQYAGGPDEGQIIANQTGFLRLGVELLKAAYAPIGQQGESSTVQADINYLVTSDSAMNFDWFERREPFEEERSRLPGRLVPVLVLSGLVIGFVLAIIGFYAVVRWLAA